MTNEKEKIESVFNDLGKIIGRMEALELLKPGPLPCFFYPQYHFLRRKEAASFMGVTYETVGKWYKWGWLRGYGKGRNKVYSIMECIETMRFEIQKGQNVR